MEKLRRIVEETDFFGGRVFDLFFQGLIIVSLIIITVETIPELSAYRQEFAIWDTIIVIIFTVEYILRIIVTKRKWAFVKSPVGLIDLLAILPFYLSFGVVDLAFLRILRLFRLLRIFKVARYNMALVRFVEAFRSIKEELLIFFTMVIFLFFISASGIYYFENPVQPEKFKSIFHSMWWAVTTFTPAASDMMPITIGGKIFTFFMLIIGLGIIAIPSGLFAAALMGRQQNKTMDNGRD